MFKLILGLTFCVLFAEGWFFGKETPNFQKRDVDITDKNLTFQLFTRNNSRNGVGLIIGDKSRLLASGFKGSLPTKICTHGFMDNRHTSWMVQMREEMLENEDVNFISLDWSTCAKIVFYEQAIECMKTAGRYLGKLLKFLQQEANLDIRKTHLIGHSLGAHLIAYASEAFSDKKTIGRMTGLDPAGPLFEHAEESERLNANSAKFVDVIHTCRIFTGMKKPIGTVDFYPNGGYFQPGCSDFDMGCHHRMSHKYFIQTINKIRRNKFLSKKCDGLNDAINGTCYGESTPMGYYSESSPPGIYYVKITSSVIN